MRGGAFFNGKEGRDDFRKAALSAVTSSLFGQERGLVRDVDSSSEGGTRWFEEFHFHPPHTPHLSLQR